MDLYARCREALDAGYLPLVVVMWDAPDEWRLRIAAIDAGPAARHDNEAVRVGLMIGHLIALRAAQP